ncbi:MAG: type II toxin-antitoxin system RelE/ParE family toxin [candidate division KSB1 bacterium]|mgnify:FL=1
MAYQVTWSLEALADVDSIAEYIARDSAVYASAVVEKILEAARKLDLFPFAGRVVPELNNQKIREKFVYSYRLIYCVEEQTVCVIAVVHGKRLLAPFKDRFDDVNY